MVGACVCVIGAMATYPGASGALLADSQSPWWPMLAVALLPFALVPLAVALGLAFNGHALLLAMTVACAGLPHVTNGIEIPTGIFKIYGQDMLLGLVLLNMAGRALVSLPGTAPLHVAAESAARFRWLFAAIVLFVTMGALQAGRALAIGTDFNDALGDFRRGYFYLLLIVFPFTLPDRRRTLLCLRNGFLIAAAIHIATGAGQVIFNKLERRMVLDAAHILAHYELVVVSFLAHWCLGRLMLGARSSEVERGELSARATPRLLAGMSLATLVVVVGNFRSVWMGFLVGGLGLMMAIPGRARLRLLGAGMAGGVLLLLAIALVWRMPVGDSDGTVGAEIVKKVTLTKEFSRDRNIVWRQQSYAAALEAWSRNRAFGTGLGVMNSFFVHASDGGVRMAERHRPHNGYLWILQTTGLVGLSLFLLLHGTFLTLLLGGLRDLVRRGRPVPVLSLAFLGFYFAFMTASGFDVLLEMSTNILALTLAMAGALLALADDATAS